MATSTAVLDRARSQLGVHESPAGSNRTPFGAWYGWNGVPWCAIFVSWVLAHSGVTPYRFAAVASSLAAARRDGRLVSSPQPGFVACKLYTATTGHTGLVEAVHGDGTITTIEGNTSGGDDRNGGIVMRRRRSAGFWNKGYIRVDYDGVAAPPVTPPPAKPPAGRCGEPHPGLRSGSRGGAIVHLQNLLRSTGSKIAADGDFGPATRDAVINFQRWAKIEADGVCGPVTWGQLHHYITGQTI